MEVAVKIMMFQKSQAADRGKEEARKLVLREAAICCSLSHPNVVATYHYEVMQASAFHLAPSGLRITDKSDEGDFKLYLI